MIFRYLIKRTKDDLIEDTILLKSDIFIYIPIEINCPFYIIKTKFDKETLKNFFSDENLIYFNLDLIESDVIQIERWHNKIKKVSMQNKILDSTNQEDIDNIFMLVNEFGVDFLNFEQIETLNNYSKLYVR